MYLGGRLPLPSSEHKHRHHHKHSHQHKQLTDIVTIVVEDIMTIQAFFLVEAVIDLGLPRMIRTSCFDKLHSLSTKETLSDGMSSSC